MAEDAGKPVTLVARARSIGRSPPSPSRPRPCAGSAARRCRLISIPGRRLHRAHLAGPHRSDLRDLAVQFSAQPGGAQSGPGDRGRILGGPQGAAAGAAAALPARAAPRGSRTAPGRAAGAAHADPGGRAPRHRSRLRDALVHGQRAVGWHLKSVAGTKAGRARARRQRRRAGARRCAGPRGARRAASPGAPLPTRDRSASRSSGSWCTSRSRRSSAAS